MWNNPQASGYADPDPARPEARPAGDAGGPPPPPAWTPGQAERLTEEWRRLQRAFAYHPHVSVAPTRGRPPTAYHVDFRVQTLIVNPQTNQLEYANAATFEVLLPAGFPNQTPVVRPVTPVFHPNVCYDGVSLDALWHPQETLVGLVRKVGDVVAYRAYDAAYAVNPAAVDWLTANRAYTPTDTQANLAPTAGGEPLARVCKYGPQSVESIRQALLATQASLLGSNPPDAAAVADYVGKTRLALSLFQEPDVPAALRAQATDLSAAAAELAESVPAYGVARDRKRRAAALRQSVKQLAAAVGPLAAEVAKLAALADATGVDDAMTALRLIPESAKLQPVQFSLPKLAAEAEKLAATVLADRRALVALNDAPASPPGSPPASAAGRPDGKSDASFGRRLAAELAAGAADAEAAAREAFEALLASEPAVKEALAEAAALDVAARWREYLDMAGKARAMERRVREFGAEGLQAYYVQNAAGKFGPFQFEQSVDLGGGDVVVRSLGGRAFEVRDPRTDQVLGGSSDGTVVLALPARHPDDPAAAAVDEHGRPATVPTRFTVTERCDDLMVLLEFLRRSTIETVQRFAAYTGPSQAWAGQVCRVLARPDVRKALEEELAKAARRWRYTILDLAALGPWKERLATYLLVHRCGAEVPPLVAVVNEAKSAHRASRKRVDQILVKSGRDLETGTLVVPPNHARQYQEELATQERSAATAAAGTARLKSLVGQLTARLQNPKLLGKGEPPTLRVVPPLPDVLATLDLSDGTIGDLVAPMEAAVQVPLGGPPPGAAATGHPGEVGYDEAEATESTLGYGAEPGESHDQGEAGAHDQETAAEPDPSDGYGYADASPADSTDAGGSADGTSSAIHDDAPATSPDRTGNPTGHMAPAGLEAAEIGAGHEAGDEHGNGEMAQPDDGGGGWVIHDDEPAGGSSEEYDQTDVAFGFDPVHAAPAHAPTANREPPSNRART